MDPNQTTNTGPIRAGDVPAQFTNAGMVGLVTTAVGSAALAAIAGSAIPAAMNTRDAKGGKKGKK
jgi:hypothetical protein